MKHIFKRIVPAPLRPLLKNAYYGIVDPIEVLLGLRNPLVPPRRLLFVGPGDFQKIGEEFFGYFVDRGGLKPSDSVLDVGCGVGRMAVPLTRYLREGRYEGIDIVSEGIEWCRKNITPRFPNFRFQRADVQNDHYNPHGKWKASEYRFPFESASFDFVFLTSVFTHMLPKDLENYLAEIARVLKSGGRCMITYFLLTQDSLRAIEEGRSTQNFRHRGKGYRTVNPDDPESSVAYELEAIRALYSSLGLVIREPVHEGSWYGRKDYLTYQDLIVAEKG